MMTPSLRIGSLTEPSNIRLVSQVEIDEVPVPGEPSKANTCKSEGDIKQFRPYPLARFCPASESVENYNQSAHGGDHSENIEKVQERSAAAAQVSDVVCAGNEYEPPNCKEQIHNANDADRQPQALLRGSQVQLPSIVPANGRPHGPEEYRKRNEDQARHDDGHVEILVVRHAGAFKNEERIIDGELHPAIRILVKSNQILPVDLAVEKRGDFLVAFQLSIGVLERVNAEGAIGIGKCLRLTKELCDFKEGFLPALAGDRKAGDLLRVRICAGYCRRRWRRSEIARETLL